MRRHLARAGALVEMIRAVNASLDPSRVAEALLAQVAGWLPERHWMVVALDEPTGVRVMATRAVPEALEPAMISVGQWVTTSGADFGAADLAADLRLPGHRRGSVLGLPLACRGRTVGAVITFDRATSASEPRLGVAARAALESALEPGALALENALRVQRAEALSVTDDLTSLYNSRYLSQVLRREAKRATRSGRPLSLLFLDLDGFKSINDTHGHLFGSRALVEAAAVIKSSARETDVVARFGGDEFALVLPDTGSEGATAVGERVRERLAAHEFLRADGLRIRLTASVGVATLPGAAETVEALIQAADKAMYLVKGRGKNGICVAGSDI